MWRIWLLGFAVACTKPNPAAVCATGTCIDPAFPFCDVDGSIGGIPGSCISVTCTPGAFGSCRGQDIALTCNAAGTSFDSIQCPLGCDPTLNGCRFCEPNQTVCTNGQFATCDATGAQTTHACPLGCFEDQPRCRDIDPSNHLSTYLDMVQNPVDLDLSTGSWYINLSDGTFNGPTPTTATSFLVPSPLGGPLIRAFVVNNLKLGDVTIFSSGANTAVAFIASSGIIVSGRVIADGTVGRSLDASCIGGGGFSSTAQANGALFDIGGAGGGGATTGGASGLVNDQLGGTPPAGGKPFGTDDLQPLVGGCSGGGYVNYNVSEALPIGESGGGAIQLSSRQSITVTGSLLVNGHSGTIGANSNEPGAADILGAGGGGGILLEAPQVILAANSTLSAVGGTGYGCTPANEFCGLPGNGGTGSSAATAGGTVAFVSAAGPTAEFIAGTGGGGAGRIRVNTPLGSYTIDTTTVQDAVVTTGLLRTR